ncbi:MAG: TonB-dependent receptor [Pseudomonadota bacterium]
MHALLFTTARKTLLTATSVFALAVAGPETFAQSNGPKASAVETPAGELRDTLFAIGQAFSVNVMAPNALVRGRRAPAVVGALSAEDALSQALVGTGLVAKSAGDDDYIIAKAAVPALVPSQADYSGKSDAEEFVVTGSRIERTAANAPSPIDIVTAAEIQSLGLTDTTEALRFVPALNQSLSLTTPELGGRTSFLAGREGTAGLATLNLRGLGADRTLVLVNGRRHVGGVAFQATVDATSIPTALIERVEVLTGGGSSIYGADAVSGVVNYVIDDDFEGVDVRSNYSLTTEGDGESYFGSVTVGGNFGDDRGNAVLNVEYQFQDDLERNDRSFTEFNSALAPNSPALAAALGTDPDAVNVVVPDRRGNFIPRAGLASIAIFGSSGAAIGGAGNGVTENGGVPTLQAIDLATGEVRPFDFGTLSGNAFFSLGGDGTAFLTGFDPLSDTIPENERISINGFADYDITPAINVFTEVKYTRSESKSRVLFSINPNDVPITQDNPFIPQVVQDQLTSLDAQGIPTALVVDVNFADDNVQRPREALRETFRIVGGIRGSLSEAFNYELSANYGRTDTVLTNNGELIPDRFFASVDAIADPDTGEPICRSDIDPDTPFPTSGFPAPALPGFNTFSPGDGSCVPTNLFALTSAEAADFFLLRTQQTFELQQFVLNGTITGNSETFFTLPAGGVGFAAGFEYRDERSAYEPDPIQIANLGFISASSDDFAFSGGFDVFEGFAEVNVPILRDKPFAQRLDLDASIRVADYSTVGTTTSYAVGTVWQPTSDLRLRGSFNRSVRAPNIGEVSSPQVTLPGQVSVDPCSLEELDNGSATRRANCAQFVPEGFMTDPFNTQFGVDITSGGNPDLFEETADTFTIGFVYQPSFVPGLTVIADYYNIDIKDGILAGVSDEIIVTNCVDASTVDNPFCDAVTRDPMTGLVTAVQATNLNLSSIRGEGIDYSLNYSFSLDRYFSGNTGDFTATLAGTYLMTREDIPFADFPETTNVLDKEIGFPAHFINFTLNWSRERLRVDYGFNFQSSQFLTFGFPFVDRELIEANPQILDEPKTGSAFVHFLGGVLQVNDAFEVSLRVNNLFNREPFAGAPQEFRFRPVSALGRVVQFGVRARF